MKLKLEINKSIEENAGTYFDKAKKAKKKIEGALDALTIAQKKLDKLQKKTRLAEEQSVKTVSKKREWYEKFRWFISSEGFIVIGGRDATTNEIIIKKHTASNDVVFHTDIPGSPFFVIKTDGKTPSIETLNESAQATAIYSRAWKLGVSTIDVFSVLPEQVSKETESGEFMTKGSFMIRGKKNYFHPDMICAIGITKEGRLIGGPIDAVIKHTEKYLKFLPGNGKSSDIAKTIKKQFKYDDVDEIIRFMPTGGIAIKK